VEYRNGRVQAGEGLDIKTVKPEFSSFTLLTALPKIPVVEISFNTAGKVKNVRMVQSSGYKDVDEPILNAVWAWTAKGKKLDALAKQNPRAVVKISIRMLL
jgi:TonB family protein